MYQHVIRMFERSKRSVPVFNDKHLSYNWDDAMSVLHVVPTSDVLRIASVVVRRRSLHRTVKRSSRSTAPSALRSSTRQSPARSLLMVLRV